MQTSGPRGHTTSKVAARMVLIPSKIWTPGTDSRPFVHIRAVELARAVSWTTVPWGAQLSRILPPTVIVIGFQFAGTAATFDVVIGCAPGRVPELDPTQAYRSVQDKPVFKMYEFPKNKEEGYRHQGACPLSFCCPVGCSRGVSSCRRDRLAEVQVSRQIRKLFRCVLYMLRVDACGVFGISGVRSQAQG